MATVDGNANRTLVRFKKLLSRLLQAIFPEEKIVLQGAGRTDAGVHALQQVASFTIAGHRDPEQFVRGLNAKFPKI